MPPAQSRVTIMFAIALSSDEQSLLSQINIDPRTLKAASDSRKNGEAVCLLMRALLHRNAIPSHRRNWFTQADCNPAGRCKSRQQVFEGNGTAGDDIFRHPHFLPYLKYFLFGPDLAHETIDRFRQAVADCGNTTSGDIGPLCGLARNLARQQRAGRDLAEEFFKLALECGQDPFDAREVSDSVKRIR
jgi:hypothetical protein